MHLKKAALETLEYEEFNSFFHLSENSSNYSEQNFYSILKKNLSFNNKQYWDALYNTNQSIIKSLLFRYEREIYGKRSDTSFYTKENYHLMKRSLPKSDINFINTDIYSLPKKIESRKYDLILFSNILSYLPNKRKFKICLDNLSSKNLNNEGVIIANYIYGYDQGSTPREIRKENRKNGSSIFLKDSKSEITTFPSMDSFFDLEDPVITYKKS